MVSQVRSIVILTSRAVLARANPNPKAPSPEGTEEKENHADPDDYSEDELSPEQPTLTLPIEHFKGDGDSFDAPPPRLSMPIEDDDRTERSVEIPRREAARNRRSKDGTVFGQFEDADMSQEGHPTPKAAADTVLPLADEESAMPDLGQETYIGFASASLLL